MCLRIFTCAYLIGALCLFLGGCGRACNTTFGGSTSPSLRHPGADKEKKPWIKWDMRSLSLIQPHAGYGRMIRLVSGEILCCFEFEGKIQVRRSDDDGRTWNEPSIVASWEHGALANPALLQIRKGSVLCFYNQRPAPRSYTTQDAYPFAICLTRSEDGGWTWQTPVTLYSGGFNFEEGCWEPVAIELPTGEIQMFFANEKPYRSTHEQEITLLRSFDGGTTWCEPETVSFRAGHRDGMPAPLVLHDNKGIVLAIEDNGLDKVNMKPVIVYTSLEDNWRSGCVDGDSPRRWPALAKPLPPPVYAGAPYMCRLPSGRIVLSFQQADDGDLAHSHMVVCIGDADARDFFSPSYPFPRTPHKGQLWNSLFVKNKDTITALSSTVINDVPGLWSIDGRVNE